MLPAPPPRRHRRPPAAAIPPPAGPHGSHSPPDRTGFRPTVSDPADPAALTVAQVRAVDRVCLDDYGLPGVVLMENAARGCAELLLDLADGDPGPVAVVCGQGNNGGDGFALARHLTIAGADVHVFAPFAEPPTEKEDPGEAAMNARVARRMGLPWADRSGLTPGELAARLADVLAAGSGWAVDALLGTGVTSSPREPTTGAVQAINAAGANGARVLAVDVPTGFDADAGRPFPLDDGQPGPCVRADATASFVARKVGFDAAGATEWTGAVHVVGIGCPREAVDRAIRLELQPEASARDAA